MSDESLPILSPSSRLQCAYSVPVSSATNMEKLLRGLPGGIRIRVGGEGTCRVLAGCQVGIRCTKKSHNL